MLSLTRNDIVRSFIIMFIFMAYGLYSQYFLLSVFAGISLVIIIKLLWRPFVPPVLLYFFVFHWLQITTIIFYADFEGSKLQDLFPNANPQALVMITLTQLILMCGVAGLIFSYNHVLIDNETLRKQVEKINVKKVLIAFLVCTLIFPVLKTITQSYQSLNQLVAAVAAIRTMLLIILMFIVLLRKTQYNTLIIAIIIAEFILGFASYFSSFKEIIVYVLIVYITVNPTVKFRNIFLLIPLLLFLGYVMIFWSYVKPDYRNYLNGYSNQQEVTVSKGDALNYLKGRAGNFNAAEFNEGVGTFIDRLQYMGYYITVEQRVPLILPHENGSITANTLKFLFVPRAIDENKGILDPSIMTAKYTGMEFKEAEEGTSIPMGYFADFFIDYGLWGMCIPLIIIAIILGFSNNYMLNVSKYNLIFTYSIFIAIIMQLGTFESDIIFFLGTIRSAAVLIIIGNWLIFPRLNKYIES